MKTILLALAVIVPASAQAQRLAPAFQPATTLLRTAPTQGTSAGAGEGYGAEMAIFGIAGGAVGLFGGAIVGFHLGGGGKIVGDDPAGMATGILGAMVGEALLLPIGVHLGNRSRGSLGATIGASLLGGAAGIALSSVLDGESAVMIPVFQLAAAMYAQHLTTPRPPRVVPSH